MHVFTSYVKKSDIKCDNGVAWHSIKNVKNVAPDSRHILHTLTEASSNMPFFMGFNEDL